MDLGFDDGQRPRELGERRSGLGGATRYNASRDRDSRLTQDLLGLKFVYFHRVPQSWKRGKARRAAGRPALAAAQRVATQGAEAITTP
jgi:hypothetical protein